MNLRQRVVLLIGLAMLLIMALFIPWSARIRIPPTCDAHVRIGYRFIFLPPSGSDLELQEKVARAGCPATASSDQISIDFKPDLKRWLIPLLLVVGISSTIFFALSDSTTLRGRPVTRGR